VVPENGPKLPDGLESRSGHSEGWYTRSIQLTDKQQAAIVAWAEKNPEVWLAERRSEPCKAALMDGEMVVQDEHGLTDFYALRSAIHKAPHRIVFLAFDVPHLDAQDLGRTPPFERRTALRTL
jgi:hypothetical protein